MADDVRPDEDQAPGVRGEPPPPGEVVPPRGGTGAVRPEFPPPEASAPAEGAPAAPPPPDAPPPAKATITPRLIRLEVQSDGTPAGTRLVDTDTGEELQFDAFAVAEVHGGAPGMPGRARVQMVFDGAPVVSASNVTHPYALLGVVLGRGGPGPLAAALGQPAAPQAAPASAAGPGQGGASATGLPGTHGSRDHAAAARMNQALNQR
jgi:hypothetical protein